MHLPKAFFENFAAATQFVRDEVYPDVMGANVMIASRSEDDPGFYMGGKYDDRRLCCDMFDEYIEDNDGIIMLNTRVSSLIQEADGTVVGVKAVCEGEAVEYRADAVVLACGGFQANPEMPVGYYGRYADNAVCRATPYNDGAGIMMGLDAGGKLSKGMGSCYGHEVPAEPIISFRAFENPEGAIVDYEAADKNDLRDLFSTQNSFDSIVIHLNLNGVRFFDEGFGSMQVSGVASMGSYINNAAILEQPYARVISVFDSKVFQQDGAGYSIGGVQTAMENLERLGGTIVKGETLEELFANLNEVLPKVHQIPAGTAVATVEEYNAACAGAPKPCSP